MRYEIVNSILLLWGSLFCGVAGLSFWIKKSYKTEKKKWMHRMQFSASALLLCDGMAYLFEGRPGRLGCWMVHVSNFGVFFLVELTLLLFHRYICATLLTPEEKMTLMRVKLVRAICWVGLALVVISQFTGLYYTFDAANVYHRAVGYPISMCLPMLAMLLDASLLMQYETRISSLMLLAMSSYFVLPLIAASIQAVHYGWALIDMAIGISMVLMFLVAAKEQNEELLQLETSRAQLAEKLEIATVLNRCVEKLSGSGHDLNKATHELLGVINDYFCADRSYVFELDPARDVAVNTHEFVRDGVSAEKDNLREVPMEVISSWMEAFERKGIYFMENVEQVKGAEQYNELKRQSVQSLLAVPLQREKHIIGFLGVDNPRAHSQDPTLLSSIQFFVTNNLEQEKNFASYEMLREQHVWRLLAVPLCRGKQIIGFLGLDNPRRHEQDSTLLSSIQFFITNSLEQKKVQEKLYRLSYQDTLTGLDNRNRYMELLEAGKGIVLEQAGGIYMDLNGLKHCNDRLGHAAGDALICRAADALNEVFPGEACRIGGDEFVVICCPVTQERFEQQVADLRAALARRDVDAAVGSVWMPMVEDMDAFLREADDRMYREKEKR